MEKHNQQEPCMVLKRLHSEMIHSFLRIAISKLKKGLSISNVANVNFKGLELEIKEGEKIYERSANKDK